MSWRRWPARECPTALRSPNAEAMTDERVFFVGGGNSAGQAAVHLARFARHVTLLVRGPSLAASMSDYLIRELDNQANLDIRYRTELVDGRGDAQLGAADVARRGLR